LETRPYDCKTDNNRGHIFTSWGIIAEDSHSAGFSMTFDPEKHWRRSIRIPQYDYSQAGAYFVTFCIANRRCILGEIKDGEIRLSKIGNFVSEQWSGLSEQYPHAVVDEFVVMPNHFHGIIHLTDVDSKSVGAGFQPAQTLRNPTRRHGLPEIIRGFKTDTGRNINRINGTPGQPVWQRNYYEHVVRAEHDLDSIRKYILENPLKWEEDEENPGVRTRVDSRCSGGKTRAYGRL